MPKLICLMCYILKYYFIKYLKFVIDFCVFNFLRWNKSHSVFYLPSWELWILIFIIGACLFIFIPYWVNHSKHSLHLNQRHIPLSMTHWEFQNSPQMIPWSVPLSSPTELLSSVGCKKLPLDHRCISITFRKDIFHKVSTANEWELPFHTHSPILFNHAFLNKRNGPVFFHF